MSDSEMSSESMYIGYADGVCRNTQNIALATWVIYSPSCQLLSSGGSCLGLITNNLVEYSVVIELLIDSIGYVVDHLIVKLDLHLVVSQLNGLYTVRNSMILGTFLRVKLLEHHF